MGDVRKFGSLSLAAMAGQGFRLLLAERDADAPLVAALTHDPVDHYSDSSIVVCPYCDCDMVNLGPVTVEQDGVAHRVGRHPRFEIEEVPTIAHGALVTLMFVCEQGHEFGVDFSFSHGTTTARVAQRHRRDYDPGTADPKTLWRD